MNLLNIFNHLKNDCKFVCVRMKTEMGTYLLLKNLFEEGKISPKWGKFKIEKDLIVVQAQPGDEILISPE